MKLAMQILITKKSQVRKFKSFAMSIQHFKNIIYLIANYYDNNNCMLPKWLLDSNELFKIVRNTIDIPEDIDCKIKEYLVELQQLSSNILGSGYTRSTIREVVRELKGVISKRKRKEKSSFPKPRKLKNTYKVTVSLNKDCYTNKLKRKRNSKNEYVVRIGLSGKSIKFRIPKDINFSTDFKITWIDDVCLVIHLTYEANIDKLDLDKDLWLSIDIGENNLLACISNHKYLRSFLIDGRKIKNIIYNLSKKLSELQSKGLYTEYRRLYLYIYRIIDYYFNIATNFIREIVKKYKIGKVFYGDLTAIFQSDKGYRKHNFIFRKIPLGRLINKLKYKLESIGCEVIPTPEYNTSKYSSVTGNKGKRKSGIIIVDNKRYHSDINGAGNIAVRNIGRKAFLNAISNVKLCNPIKLYLFATYNWKNELIKIESPSPLTQ